MKIVKYILSVIFILSGLTSLKNSLIGSILLICLGIILFPNISEFIKSKLNKWNSKGIRYTLYGLLFFFGSATTNYSKLKDGTELKNKSLNSESMVVLEEEKIYLENLKDSINEILLKQQLDICTVVNDISLLEQEAIKLADKKYPNFDYPQHSNYSEKLRISKTNSYLNKNNINQVFLDKVLLFNVECAEKDRLSRIENLKIKKVEQKIKKEAISKCLEAACSIVPDKIKSQLHNPKSFEKVNCKYLGAKGTTFSISITYRGENAFGSIRTEKKIADINIETCKLIRHLQNIQNPCKYEDFFVNYIK